MGDIGAGGWALLALAAAIIGLSKTGFPGVGILAIPLAAMVFPGKSSTGLILPMLIAGDVLAVSYYRRHAVWKYLVKPIPCAAAGIIVGAELMQHLSGQGLQIFIGLAVLVMLGLGWWRQAHLARTGEITVPTGWWFPVTIGLIAGITTMMANAAGPIMLVYLLAMRLPKDAFLGTGAWYFLLLNVFKVPFSAGQGLITLESLRLNLYLLPVIVLAGLLGVPAAKVLPEKAFTRLVQILAAAGAVQLVHAGIAVARVKGLW